MKTLILTCIAIIFMAFADYTESYTLQEALNRNLIDVKINSLGVYQGQSAMIEVKNKTSKNFIIKIEAGRKLKAREDKYQDLLVVKQEDLIVKSNAKASTKVVGFCCESNDAGPKNNLKYLPNQMADTNLIKLAKYINLNYTQLNTSAVQQAIWAISNNHGSAAITVLNEKEMTLKNLVCTIKNEPIPWYIIKQRIYQTTNGRIHLCNDTLQGKINYTNGAWTYSKLNIYDKEKNAVFISVGSWLKPGSNSVYDVNLPIKTLPKGKYTLSLENEQQVFTQRDIEI
ncbi:MAG: hypothetical protein JNM96_08170 [Bacteroidia bacterium]|nr:hypothetical protein [Bacteroidia bacterium]